MSQAAGRWASATPCPGWDAGGIVEHVIGFHDVLVLRPLGAKPERSKGDPAVRWALTEEAIVSVMERLDEGGAPTEPVPADIARLVPALTTEVLVHSWDLSTALGVDPSIDVELWERALAAAQRNEEQIRASGMFGQAVVVPENSDVQTRLVAFLGRDPGWRP